MAQLQRSFVRRWPVAVLATAAVAAVSLGDLVAGWYAVTGRGPSAAGEYPVRIALRQSGPASGSRLLAPAPELGAAEYEADGEAATTADDAADLLRQPSASPSVTAATSDRGAATDRSLVIQFDLADAAESWVGGSAIEIRKAIRVNGADAGDASIHMNASSELSIAREELGRLLAGSGRQELVGKLGSGGRFVSFDEMRSHGIEVRYDPVSDRILISI